MELVFRDDPYAKSCEATVTAVSERGIELDRTVFYAMSGGQAGDVGRLVLAEGGEVAIVNTIKGEGPDSILHVPAEGATLPAIGAKVSAEIDWERRHRLMRMHTAMHLLSVILPFPVTGGQISDGKGRLDFNMPEAPPAKDHINAELARLVAAGYPVASRWISEEELEAQPDLVKTMAVQPPKGAGRVRLIDIESLDLQPCGGTHVANTAEIGKVAVRKIESKGRQNRRVSLIFDE